MFGFASVGKRPHDQALESQRMSLDLKCRQARQILGQNLLV